MTLNIDLEDVPFAILEAVKARILRNRSLLDLYNQQNPQPSLRPGPQFVKQGGSRRGWRLQKQAAMALGGDTLLLLPLNTGVGFSDRGDYALTVEPKNNAIISTSQSRFGNASAYFNGIGSHLAIENSKVSLANRDFTIELWFYAEPAPSNGKNDFGTLLKIGPYNRPWEDRENNPTELLLFQTIARDGVQVRWNQGSSILGGDDYVSYNTWHHVAIVRLGSTLRLYVNGALQDEWTNFLIPAFTSIHIGSASEEDNSGDIFYSHYKGYIDMVRIKVNKAVYTQPFTPPAGPLSA